MISKRPIAHSLIYLYDNNGNRTPKTTNGVQENYTYGPNDRILTAENRLYVTGNNGNVTSVTVSGQTTSLTLDRTYAGWLFSGQRHP